MTEDESKFKPKEKNTPTKRTFEGTHYQERLNEFWKANAEDLGLNSDDYEKIVEGIVDGSILNTADFTSRAHVRAKRHGVPFMKALTDVIEDNKRKKKSSFWDRLGGTYGANSKPVSQEDSSQQPGRTQEQGVQDPLEGLDEQKRRLGYPSGRNQIGSLKQPPIKPGQAARKESFRQAQIRPEEKPKRKKER